MIMMLISITISLVRTFFEEVMNASHNTLLNEKLYTMFVQYSIVVLSARVCLHIIHYLIARLLLLNRTQLFPDGNEFVEFNVCFKSVIV